MFETKTVLPLLGGKDSKPSPVQKRIADKALRNVIEPFPNYADIDFSSDFDWEHREPGIETSYQLYLQNLRVVGTLLAEFERSGNEAYLIKADEIVLSWMNFVESGRSTEMTWYDHAVGARARVLMQYLALMEGEHRPFPKQRFVDMLDQHATLLMDDSLHRMNNHGLMMDMALISLGLGLGRYDYVFRGIGRAESIFWQTFSETGMHQENSPEYHNMVMRMYRELETFLNVNDLTLGEGVLTKLRFNEQHMKRISKPDGKVPNIGDTGSQRNIRAFNWQSFRDEMSGFAVLKDKSSELYLAFICGYSAKAHKHADDLSILLNYKAKDFFVDSGKYNYGKNVYRKFVASYRAHSSFNAGRAYVRPADNRYSKVIATDHFLDAKELKLVSGYNFGFTDAKLRRSVYAVPDRSLVLIRDQGVSKRNETWTHRFVLSPEVNVELMEAGAVKLTNGDAEVFLSWVGQDVPELAIEHGEISKTSVKAVISNATNKVTKTTHLVFSHTPSTAVDARLCISFGEPMGAQIVEEGGHLKIEGQPPATALQLPLFDL